MVRQSLETQPWRKHLEIYTTFSGGLNTNTANQDLRDNELPALVNFDLDDRGTLKKRHGMEKLHDLSFASNSQGFFRFFKDGALSYIVAANGKLYKQDGTEIVIQGLPGGFQTDRSIEAVQFKEKLYIATGTKLVEFDGTTAKVIVPYKPKPNEALYVGTNSLADNPNAYLDEEIGTELAIKGAIPDKQYGVVNQVTNFTVYLVKQADTVIEYSFKFRKKGTETWQDREKGWTTSNVLPFEYGFESEWEILFLARVQGSVTEVSYSFPNYKINLTDKNDYSDTSKIHECNQILLHWERLVLYGDPNQTETVYFSDLNKPDYFPKSNTVKFSNERGEAITKLVQFRDMIVTFTKSTIQALFGKGPSDFNKVMLNTTVGCIAGETARVVENQIFFLSADGIYRLVTVGLTQDQANVEKMDINIQNHLPQNHTNACATFHRHQYQIVFPSESKRFRYYIQFGAWVQDDSPLFSFHKISSLDGILIAQRKEAATIYQFDINALTDDGHIYETYLETKLFDFGQPYHKKKLKELYIITAHAEDEIPMRLEVYADGQEILSPITGKAFVNESGFVDWEYTFENNFTVANGTIFDKWKMGQSPFGDVDASMYKFRLSGKCRRSKITILLADSVPQQILGIGYVFKVKKP